MLEIKKLNSIMSPFFGDICVYLELNDYADTSTIKCKIANLNEEIIPDKFAYDGSPYFSYDKFEKYSNGNHYARVYVEVEYKSKELELSESTFNTAKGINDYIVDLKTLHHIMGIRHVAKHKKGIKLNEFVWRGVLSFDQFGQTMYLYDQKFIDDTPNNIKYGTVDYNTFRFYCEGYCGTFRVIPDQDEICPECNKAWTIDNIVDYVTIEKGNYKRIGYHKECLKSHNDREQLKEFENIFSKVYNLSELKFTAIPNEYCSCEKCASWFIVSTLDGDIKIGWRKRVISIVWLDNYKRFKETFVNEDTTKGGNLDGVRYIHAWNVDKAIEYLNRAKDRIV